MPKINNYGYGPFTQKKLSDYDCFMKDYLAIAKAVIDKHGNKKWADRKFHYIDMNAGPGILTGLEPYVSDGSIGSPLVFLKHAQLYQLDYQADMIEYNKQSFLALRNNLDNAGLLSDNCRVWHEDHYLAAKKVTKGIKKWKWGLVYHDPNNGSFEILKYLSICRPRYDILINMPCALFKRNPSHYNDEILLSDHMIEINKTLWFIKDLSLSDKHQWTFLLGTNFASMREFKRIGLLHIHKPEGAKIFEHANLSKKQIKKKYQPMLPMESI
ncbi:MAG: hypothetical protein ACXAB7_25290 [Candidatus Kariarchaeaceae archaeon]|jgi:hypothetical protein